MLDDHLRRHKLKAREVASRSAALRSLMPERSARLADQLYTRLMDQIARGGY